MLPPPHPWKCSHPQNAVSRPLPDVPKRVFPQAPTEARLTLEAHGPHTHPAPRAGLKCGLRAGHRGVMYDLECGLRAGHHPGAMYDFIQVLRPSAGGPGSYPTCIGEGTEAREAGCPAQVQLPGGQRAHPPGPRPSSCPKAPGNTTC